MNQRYSFLSFLSFLVVFCEHPYLIELLSLDDGWLSVALNSFKWMSSVFRVVFHAVANISLGSSFIFICCMNMWKLRCGLFSF